MATFKFGNQVIIKKNDFYSITTGGQIGTILNITEEKSIRNTLGYKVSFDNKVWVKLHERAGIHITGGFSPEARTFYILPEYLELLCKPTIEDRVQERIKTLWNNSNWVKNNPSQAY